MATLGDTSEPTNSAEAFDNAYISFGHVLTMPAGGPWLITDVGGWCAGYGENSTVRNVLWSGSTGAILEETATYTAVQRTFTASGSDLYNKPLLNGGYVIAGGSSIIVGVRRNAGHAIFFGKRATGSYRRNEITTMVSNETISTGAMGAYVTYEASNSAPNAPTLNDPTGGEIVASQTPTLNFTPSDPDGDNHTGYTYQVDDNSDFSSPVESTEVNGTFTNAVAINRVITSTLTRGTTSNWRVKTKDAANGYGAYSAGTSFKIAQLPTASVTAPANAQTAELYFTAGTSGNPKIKARWSYNCPDGHAQERAVIRIYADSGGSPGSLLNTDTYTGSGTSFDTTYAVVENTKYHVSVQPRCSLLVEGVESSKNITRTRWARASYFFDSGATPVTLSSAADTTVGANQAIVLEYTATGSSSEPGTWYANIASAGLNRFFWHRATMFAWGSATPTSPKLNSVTWTYSANGLVLDDWTVASGGTVDTGTFVYGTQSLKHATNGAGQSSYQVINVTEDTAIILSGRARTLGTPAAELRIMDAGGTTTLASVSIPNGADWARYATPVINTGSATSVRVVCFTSAAGGSSAWFDALKAEASTVVTPWTPGFIAAATTVDAGGLQVNALGGGVFRLRGSDAAGLSSVELGQWGLEFETDTAADEPIQVRTNTDTNDRFHVRTDGGLRWGSGSATPDVGLDRGAADRLDLASGDSLRLVGGQLQIGSDVVFERKAADLGGTDDPFRLGLTSVVAAKATEGAASWDDTLKSLHVGDGSQARPITPIGWTYYCWPWGTTWVLTDGGAANLSAVSGGNAGELLTPIIVPATMELHSVLVYCSDTATARSAEWGLYRATSATQLDRVAADASGTFSFTPSAASWRESVAAADTIIPPGSYWVVIRNTSSTQTFGIGHGSGTGQTGAPGFASRVDSSAPALGATITDLGVANTTRSPMVALSGNIGS